MRTHKEVMQKEKASLKRWKTNQQKENCNEINDEPQNNVALRKVGAGKATGRACRPKQEQNEVFVTSKMGLQTKTPVSVFVCVCLCVCEEEEGERKGE